MGPVASRALRSSIAAIAVFVLVFVAAELLDPMPYANKLDRLGAMAAAYFSAPTLIAAALVGWLALWLCFATGIADRRDAQGRSWMVRAGEWGRITVLWSAAVAGLGAAAYAAFFGWPLQLPAFDSLVFMFEAALFAVAIVRIALPLLPSFERMSPQTS